jgi:hypothetical protein
MIDQRMARELLEHVIEKTDPVEMEPSPVPSTDTLTEMSVSLVLRATVAARAFSVVAIWRLRAM